MEEKVVYGELMIRVYLNITDMIIKDMDYNNRNVYKKSREKRRKEILEAVVLAKQGFYKFKLISKR